MTVLATVLGTLMIFIPGMIVGAIVAFIYRLFLGVFLGALADPASLVGSILVYWFSPFLHGGVAGATSAVLTRKAISTADKAIVGIAVPVVHVAIALSLLGLNVQLAGLKGLGQPSTIASYAAMVVGVAIMFYVAYREPFD